MGILSPGSFTWLTIVIYLLASASGLAGMLTGGKIWRAFGRWLALGAYFCQTFFLVTGFHRSFPGGPSTGAYLQLLAWFLLLCGIGAWWRLRHDALILFAAPLGLILFLMSAPSLNMAVNLPQSLTSPFYALHIGSLFLSLGLLGLAFMAGIVFLFLQNRIKSKKSMRGIWRDMPALELLDRINSACVLGAFPLYTIGLTAGLFWSRPIYGSMLTGDPKEIVSIVVWILLAALFHNRLAKGWKGRKPAILAITVFVISVLSFLGVNFLLTTHHSFWRG